jgi:uncharacterized pyridoxal phosphate-containing UPF0001 family protein
MSISQNLQRLHNEIADACAHAHRDPANVRLMAVTKTHPAEAILEALAAGHRLFGENRVQEWQSKSQQLRSHFGTTRSLPPDAQSHLIGPLQSNKTAKAAELFDAIDTLDSLKTATRLNEAVGVFNQQHQTLNQQHQTLNQQHQTPSKTLPILIEVKLSPEAAKHGLEPHALPAFLAALAPLTHLRPSGLMTVPPFSEDPELARPYFQQLRRLRDENRGAHPNLTELSMGMSNDFRVAISEGSTTVRIGTAIFGSRTYAQP